MDCAPWQTSLPFFAKGFREDLAVYLSTEIMLKTSVLCFPEHVSTLQIGPFLRDAFVVIWLSEWRGNKAFNDVLPILQRDLHRGCQGQISMQSPRRVNFQTSWRKGDEKMQPGASRLFLDRHRRLISDEPQEDLAIILLEAAGVLRKRFLLQEALAYPSEKVVQSAKRIQKYIVD